MKKNIENKTMNKIITSAITVFSSLPYKEVPLSQITNLAGISNGSIYNYFKTKEELFKYLLNEACERIKKEFLKIEGEKLEERLYSFIELNFNLARKEFNIIKIFREGQYKFIEYEQKLRKIYIGSLKKIFKRDISEVEYLYIMSGIRFININFTNKKIPLNIEFLVQRILKGMLPNWKYNYISSKEKKLYKIVPFEENEKKNYLINSGEYLFGKNGYHETKIEEITKEIGMATGTFYNYFSNKEVFLSEMTKNLSSSILFFVEYNSDESSSQIKKQIDILDLIMIFFEKTPYKYQILRDSEFISETISREYLEQLENLCIESFKETSYSQEEKKILGNMLVGLSHYLGIEMFFTKNIENRDKILEELSKFFSDGVQ
jgi:AcrR family transcriptional regulator